MVKENLRKYILGIFILIGLGGIIYKNMVPDYTVYIGTGEGYNDSIELTIQAKKNKNNEIRILKIDAKHNDTPAIAGPAIEELKAQTLSKQSADIDGVSGATYTSEGYKDALKDAISKIK